MLVRRIGLLLLAEAGDGGGGGTGAGASGGGSSGQPGDGESGKGAGGGKSEDDPPPKGKSEPPEGGRGEGSKSKSEDGGGDDQGDDGDARQQLATAEALVEKLRGDLNDTAGRRKVATGRATKAERERDEANAKVTQLQGDIRRRDAVETVLAKVPAEHRKHARDSLLALDSRGALDLGAEDAKAAVKAAETKLREEYAEYFEERGGLPRLPGASNGVRKGKVGVQDSAGQRIL